MACELPTATASASTPVAAAYLAASPGGVLAPASCTPSLPPISPISASTHTPRSWHHRVTSAVAATFCSYGAADASYMTEPTPRAAAARTRSSPVTWSRCTATGTAAHSAKASAARAIGASAPW